jgi:hypothetical protein
MKEYLQSNTVRLALATILGAGIAYLNGQVDGAGAGLLILTGLLQLLQRTVKIRKEGKPPRPGEFPGIDAGGPGVMEP